MPIDMPEAEQMIPDGHALNDVSIRPADNGVTVRHSTRPVKPKKGDMGMFGPDREHVFGDHKSALKHVGTLLRQHAERGGGRAPKPGGHGSSSRATSGRR